MKRYFSVCRMLFLLLMFANMSSLFAQTDKPFENSHFVTIDGVLIHYRDWNVNENNKGHILFIHGFSGSTFSW